MTKEAIEDYAEAIQNHFGQKRGAPLLMSPGDFLAIEEWFAMGIPLDTVRKGIDRHFGKADQSKRRKMIVVSFAQGAILDEWAILKAGGVGPTGKASPEVEAAERKERLDVFFRQCRKKAHEGAKLWTARLFVELADRACQAIQTQCGSSTVGTLKPLSELAQSYEDHITTFLKVNATPKRMQTARRTAKQDLAPYRDKMSNDAYHVSLEFNTLEALRIELGVPKLMDEC